MRTTMPTVLIGTLLAGCAAPGQAPRDAAGVATGQAALAGDELQAALWRDAAQRRSLDGLPELLSVQAPVRQRHPLLVPDTPVESKPTPYPASVRTALQLSMPAGLAEREPYAGPAMVARADGEFVTLRLPDRQLVRLQARVAGEAPRLAQGETVQLQLRSGTPFRRRDVLVLRGERDDLAYALVGDGDPVSVSFPGLGVAARQDGEPAGNSLRVAVSAGQESRLLAVGEEAVFAAAGVTVKVLASVAVQGEAANVLPGEPYRLELIAWRSRGG